MSITVASVISAIIGELEIHYQFQAELSELLEPMGRRALLSKFLTDKLTLYQPGGRYGYYVAPGFFRSSYGPAGIFLFLKREPCYQRVKI